MKKLKWGKNEVTSFLSVVSPIWNPSPFTFKRDQMSLALDVLVLPRDKDLAMKKFKNCQENTTFCLGLNLYLLACKNLA